MRRFAIRKLSTKVAAPVALLLVVVSISAADGAPEIHKVEPPNWWVGHSINPVRLLIRGRNLGGARVEAVGEGLSIGSASAGQSGTYLFVDVSIDRQTAPGRRALRVITNRGTAEAKFEISRPFVRAGCFQGFRPDDVIYLIMPDRFSDGDAGNNDPPQSRGMYSRANPRGYHGGDLQGIIDRLPFLKDLGITAIWTTPVYDNADRAKDYEWGKNVADYHGYGAIDFYRVEEHLGTLDKYKELTERAHALGIKIIQDQVANHTGPDHIWASDPPTQTWLNGTPANHLNNVFDIKSVVEESPNRSRFEATLRGWFGNTLPDINQDDPEAARYLIQNAVWWVAVTGLDGIRQDTFPYAPRRFWNEWNLALAAEFPELCVVGEVFDQRPEVTSFFQGGRARFDGVDTHLDTVFDFPSYFAIRDVFIKGQPMKRLAEVLEGDGFYPDPRVLVTFLGNHDVPRFLSEPGASVERLKLAFTYLLTMRGTPQIYYGDEIGMLGGADPDNRRDFPGGFRGDSRDAFTSAGRTRSEREIFKHVRELLRQRANHAALRSGTMRILVADGTQLAYIRETERERIIVVINNSDRAARVEVPIASGAWTEAAPSGGRWLARAARGKITVPLPPRDSRILVENRNLKSQISNIE